jgi:hypothetical protein
VKNLKDINLKQSMNGVWRDLRDKRLWPVAAVLVLALVAIPVVLAKPAPKGAPAPGPVATASADGPAPLVASPASIRSNTGGAIVVGKFKDPFHQQHVPAAPKTDAGSSPGGDSKPSSSDAGSGGGGGGGSAPSGGSANSGKTIHTHSEPRVKKLKVEFGKADGDRKVLELTPGSPLPGASNPLIVFTDFGSGGKRPVFLISSDVVKSEGDGSCKPSKAICSEMSIGVGDTQFFDILGGDQYQLDVLGIVKD